MGQLPKLLVTLGVVMIIIGLLWQFAGRFISIGKLPGDIFIQKGNSTFYFPIMTSIIISIILSLLFFISGRFR